MKFGGKNKLYFSMKEICEIFNIEPHIIRYWEKNIDLLKPTRKAQDRKFTQKDIDIIEKIYHLVYKEKYTVAGADKKIKEIFAAENNPTDREGQGLKDILKNIYDDTLSIKKIIQDRKK